MLEWIARTWAHVLLLGAHYGVDATLFAALYVAHHPLFWGTMAWLAARARRGQSVKALVALGVFFWTMPYAYVLLFGRGLPIWAYAVAVALLAIGGIHLVQDVRRRLYRARLQATAAPPPEHTPSG